MVNLFGEALREKRRDAGISQRELADKIGVDFSYISKVENGRLPPPAADTVVKICRVLGTKPEELLALTGKIPSLVQRGLSTSEAAQDFLQQAQGMGLSEEEWRQMVRSLKGLREE
jgi:transcriptional regulator with XRE-family HTH domain